MKYNNKEQKIAAVSTFVRRNEKSKFVKDNNMKERVEAVKRGEVYDGRK